MVRPKGGKTVKRVFSVVAALALLGALATSAIGANAPANPQACAGWLNADAAINFPVGTWKDGETHTLSTMFTYPDGTFETEGPLTFTVSNSASLYPGYVQLHWWGLVTVGYEPLTPENVINPAQRTVFRSGYSFGPTEYAKRSELLTLLAGAPISVSIDGGDWVVAPYGPLTSACASPGGYTIANDKSHTTGEFHRHF
jgi:hypothetical protein